MTPRQIAGLVVLFAGVIVLSAGVGVGAAWLVYGRSQGPPPVAAAATTQPTTQPALMEPAEDVTITGKAVCQSCFLGIGPLTRHPLVLETDQPYRTLLLADNESLREIKAITGSCAAGDLELTATGDVLVVNEQNVLVVRSFTYRALETGPTTQPEEST